MEVIFYIDTELKIILEHFKGNVTGAKVVKGIPNIWNHPKYDPFYDRIADFRDCNLNFSHEGLYLLIKSISDFSQRIQGRAAVLVSEPISAAAVSMYSDQMKNIHRVGLFCSDSEVVNYLGVDPAIFKKIDDPEAVRVTIE